MESIDLYCVVDPQDTSQTAENIVKSIQAKKFAWWSTTINGRKAISENNLVSYTSQGDAQADAGRRLSALKIADELLKEAEKIEFSTSEKIKSLPSFKAPWRSEDRSYKTPSHIIELLADKIKSLEKESEKYMSKHAFAQSQHFVVAINTFSQILTLLKSNDLSDFKKAVLKYAGMSNMISVEMPIEVSKYILSPGLSTH